MLLMVSSNPQHHHILLLAAFALVFSCHLTSAQRGNRSKFYKDSLLKDDGDNGEKVTRNQRLLSLFSIVTFPVWPIVHSLLVNLKNLSFCMVTEVKQRST